jgi:hypothetical protein
MSLSRGVRKRGYAWALVTQGSFLALILTVFLPACAPVVVPPPVTHPSVVTSQEGVAFYVTGLKLPGTRQELRLKEGGAITWIPLAAIDQLRFTGPMHESYRPAIIVLTSGERVQSEVRVGDLLLEGVTDLGYWNMPLKKVIHLKMGTR